MCLFTLLMTLFITFFLIHLFLLLFIFLFFHSLVSHLIFACFFATCFLSRIEPLIFVYCPHPHTPLNTDYVTCPLLYLFLLLYSLTFDLIVSLLFLFTLTWTAVAASSLKSHTNKLAPSKESVNKVKVPPQPARKHCI